MPGFQARAAALAVASLFTQDAVLAAGSDDAVSPNQTTVAQSAAPIAAPPQTLEKVEVVGRVKKLDEARNGLSPDTGSTIYHFDQNDIALLPLGDSTPLNQVILRALQSGRIPPPFDVGVREVPHLRESSDFFGLNYYSRSRIALVSRTPRWVFGHRFTPDDVEQSDVGSDDKTYGEIYAHGLYRALRSPKYRPACPVASWLTAFHPCLRQPPRSGNRYRDLSFSRLFQAAAP